jgi:hypothetical protein
VPTFLKSGSLNLLEPSGPVKACNGTALPFYVYNRECPVRNLVRNLSKTRVLINQVNRTVATQITALQKAGSIFCNFYRRLARATHVTCASGVVAIPTPGHAGALCIAHCLIIQDDFARMARKHTRRHERSPTVANYVFSLQCV